MQNIFLKKLYNSEKSKQFLAVGTFGWNKVVKKRYLNKIICNNIGIDFYARKKKNRL